MAGTRNRAAHATGRGSTKEGHGRLADERLVDAIVQHDPAALAEAYSQHGSPVHAIARGLCGDTRAEDLTHEIFLQL
ncbi:MAG TPA: hypothetical protein VGR26_19140, partial [Acidimicrobiales bacterium]|nr:hypothetical protein [Acidimicrobiales bacterium]